MTTLPNMGIILPVLGGDSGSWDDKLNAGLTLVDAHDHTSGKGVQVPSAGININADLSFGGFTITALGKIAFQAIAAPSSGSPNLFVNSSDNELYWRTNAGVNVKLTSGSSINTTLVGGILGDYSSVGAVVAYDDANDRYTFKQQGTNPWARVSTGGVELYEFNTTESVYVRLNAPSVLGASYDVTFASALPGSTSLAQISSTGQLIYSNTLAQTVTFSDVKLTAARQRIIPPVTYLPIDGNFHVVGGVDDFRWNVNGYWDRINPNSGGLIIIPIVGFEVGDVFTTVGGYFNKLSDNTNTITFKLKKTTTAGALTTVATATNSENAPGNRSYLFSGLSETVDTNINGYHVEITFSDNTPSGTDSFYSSYVGYTRP